MQHAGVLVFLLPLVPALALASAAVIHNAYRQRRTRWLEKRLVHICREVENSARDPATPTPSRPADWHQILDIIGVLTANPETLQRYLAPVTETAAPFVGDWTVSAVEGLTPDHASIIGKKQQRLICGHLALLHRTRTTAPILFLASCLLEGNSATTGAAALLIGHQAEAYADATIPLAAALREGPPQAAPTVAWALLRVLLTHSELIALLDSDPSAAVRRTALQAAAAAMATGQKPPWLLDQIGRCTADTDPGVRVLAYRTLRYLKPAKRLALAKAGLSDPIPEAARAATRALASEGSREAIDVLIQTLNEAGPKLQREALDALTQSPTTSTAASGSELPGADSAAQAWALEVWATTGNLEDTEVLGFLRHPQTAIRRAAAHSLCRLVARAPSRSTSHNWLPQLLVSWQRENDPQVLVALAECLATSSRDVASEIILKRLANVADSVREQLLEVLARTELFHQIEAMQPERGPLPDAGEAGI